MKLLRSALLLLSLLLSTTALAAPTEQTIRTRLPGLWHADFTIEGVKTVGTSTFNTDGTVVYVGRISAPGVDMPYRFKATWTVSGTTLTTTLTQSSFPDLMPVGTVERDTVLAISDTAFTYVDNEGTEVTETRPAAK